VISLEIPKLKGGSTIGNLESRDEGNKVITVSYYIVPARVEGSGKLTMARGHYKITYTAHGK
jgi:hypothetical protein